MLTNSHSPLQPCQGDIVVFAAARRQIEPKQSGQRGVRHGEQKVENDWAAYCVKQQLI